MRATKGQQKRAPASLPKDLNKRLAAYALAATAGLLTGAPVAEATIVYKPLNISVVPKISASAYSRGSGGPIQGAVGFSETVQVPIAGLGATLDIRAGFRGGCYFQAFPGVCDPEHASGGGASLLKGAAATGSFLVGPGASALSRGAAKLPSGALISQSRPKSRYGRLLWYMETDPSGGSLNGAWFKGGSGFLGFSDQGHAGWVGLNFSRISACVPGFRNGCFDPLGKINVTGYAYETNRGVSIRAGQTSAVPEPGTLSLLAFGAAGLLALRKRNHLSGARCQR